MRLAFESVSVASVFEVVSFGFVAIGKILCCEFLRGTRETKLGRRTANNGADTAKCLADNECEEVLFIYFLVVEKHGKDSGI